MHEELSPGHFFLGWTRHGQGSPVVIILELTTAINRLRPSSCSPGSVDFVLRPAWTPSRSHDRRDGEDRRCWSPPFERNINL